MSSEIYIQRLLDVNGEHISEDDLLSILGIAVVLAEPGAGKTELLKSLATKLNTEPTTAKKFPHQNLDSNSDALIIDALDEFVRIDQTALEAISVKAYESGAKKVILACRSGHWEEARTRTLNDCFGKDPIIVRLNSFTLEEQLAFFEAYKPNEEFSKFLEAVYDADLGELLGNPLFLQLFSDAYVWRKGKFESKTQAISDAIKQLVIEANPSVSQTDRLPSPKIISYANEIFAKILLSGATGLSTVDRFEDKDFPFINALVTTENQKVETILSTRLFKPSFDTNDHEPIHRIIVEFSAARYLVHRIQNSNDPLSLNRCLALIAPNSVVRGELRGLLAWIAAVGDIAIQKRVIELDSYAILANGDPSQLEETSKYLLLEQLSKNVDKNPYFRGEDIWRDFSASGFFTEDTVDAVKSILTEGNETTHLPGLILELLRGSPAVPILADYLRELVLDPEKSETTRHGALVNLIDVEEHDHIADFNTLLNERSLISVELATEIAIYLKNGTKLSRERVLNLLNSIIDIHYSKAQKNIKFRKSRFFIKRLIETFERDDVIWFLDQISHEFRCICGEKYSHDCECRDGKSSIIGRLFDHLFEISKVPPSAQQIYRWCKSLNFNRYKNSENSSSVKTLQENHGLRQSVHRLVFETLTTNDAIRNMHFALNFRGGHSGLSIHAPNDIQAILDHAFETDNVILWSNFLPYHQYNQEKKFANPLRAYAREQAHSKIELGRVWALKNRLHEEQFRSEEKYYQENTKVRRRRTRKKEKIVAHNQRHFEENLPTIERGQHWEWLKTFAHGYLTNETEHYPILDDIDLPERALRNCFGFLKDHIPTLTQLGQGKGNIDVVIVLHAACLAQFRNKGSLDTIDHQVLKVVKTDSDMCYFEKHSAEIEDFNNEIDRQIFKTQDDVELFLRNYFEPQLEEPNIICNGLGWLNHRETFSLLREKLPIEWLERFPNLAFDPVNTFFDIAAAHSDLFRLRTLIHERCEGFGSTPHDEDKITEFERNRNFWFFRQFIFEEDISDQSRKWLREDKDRIFVLSDKFRFLLRNESNGWPALSAEKIYLILILFVNQWPKVDLPNSFGTGDPPEEIAYRFMKDIIWRIEKDKPGNIIPVLDRILTDKNFSDFHSSAKALRFNASKKLALQDYEAPSLNAIVEMLDNLKIASVEDLRVFLLEELDAVQSWAQGGETDGRSFFYEKEEHVKENQATKLITNQLRLQCNAQNLAVTIEHQLADNKRCDFTIRSNIDGSEKLLVIEVKGQWHPDLYTAAAEQLHERYSNHPNAEGQGIFLVLWFGKGEKIAGKKKHSIKSPKDLRTNIIANMPPELHALIDVIVLDLSK